MCHVVKRLISKKVSQAGKIHFHFLALNSYHQTILNVQFMGILQKTHEKNIKCISEIFILRETMDHVAEKNISKISQNMRRSTRVSLEMILVMRND